MRHCRWENSRTVSAKAGATLVKKMLCLATFRMTTRLVFTDPIMRVQTVQTCHKTDDPVVSRIFRTLVRRLAPPVTRSPQSRFSVSVGPWGGIAGRPACAGRIRISRAVVALTLSALVLPCLHSRAWANQILNLACNTTARWQGMREPSISSRSI